MSLTNYFKQRPPISNTVLFTNRFGKQLGSRGVEKIINKYMLQINIRDACVQSLRHTFGIHHIMSGAKLKTIQDLMGHRDSRTTSSYSSLVKDVISKEIQEHTL
jgi:integrase/recombinase XerD